MKTHHDGPHIGSSNLSLHLGGEGGGVTSPALDMSSVSGDENEGVMEAKRGDVVHDGRHRDIPLEELARRRLREYLTRTRVAH